MPLPIEILANAVSAPLQGPSPVVSQPALTEIPVQVQQASIQARLASDLIRNFLGAQGGASPAQSPTIPSSRSDTGNQPRAGNALSPETLLSFQPPEAKAQATGSSVSEELLMVLLRTLLGQPRA